MVFSCARDQARHHIMKAAVLVSLLGFLVNLDCVAGSVIYKSINWVPQNPIFVADGKTCGPGARNIAVQLQSKVHFICPNTATVLESSLVGVQPADMYENLWLLYNKTAFDKCDVSQDPKRRLLLSCKTPMKLSFFPVLFAQYTAEPNGLIFEGGRWYYFIATSDGTESHLNRTRGGHCNDTTNKVHMKLAVYVCKKSNATYTDPKCLPGDVGVIQCPQIRTVATTTTTTPATTAPQTTAPQTTAPQQPEPTSTPSGTEMTSRTVKTTPTTNGNVAVSPQGQKQPRSSDDGKHEVWRAIAIVALVCLVVVIGFVIYLIKFGREKNYCHNTKVSHRSQDKPSRQRSIFGVANRSFNSGKPAVGSDEVKRVSHCDSPLGSSPFYGINNENFLNDNSTVTSEVDGRKPSSISDDDEGQDVPEKDVSIVIQNKDVYFDNKGDKGGDGNFIPHV